jgi:hypothetical protein
MAEVASEMTTLHREGIDGTSVKRDMEDCEWDEGKDVEKFGEGHGKEKERRDKGVYRALEADKEEKEKKRGRWAVSQRWRKEVFKSAKAYINCRATRDGFFLFWICLMGGVIRGARSLDYFFFLSNFDNSQASSSSVHHPALPLIQ